MTNPLLDEIEIHGRVIGIEHHKAGAIIDYPLEADGLTFRARRRGSPGEALGGIPIVLCVLKERQAVRVQHHATHRSAHA